MKRFLVGNNVWSFFWVFQFTIHPSEYVRDNCERCWRWVMPNVCKTLHKTKNQHTQMNKYHIKFHQWSRQCLDNRPLELNDVMTPHYDATWQCCTETITFWRRRPPSNETTRIQLYQQVTSTLVVYQFKCNCHSRTPSLPHSQMRAVHDPHWPCPTAKTENHLRLMWMWWKPVSFGWSIDSSCRCWLKLNTENEWMNGDDNDDSLP